jgi:hypothetical protein
VTQVADGTLYQVIVTQSSTFGDDVTEVAKTYAREREALEEG